MRTSKTADPITLEEAIRLYDFVDITAVNRAVKLYKHFINKERIQCDAIWALFSSLGVIYSIGRIQGIRDERYRRKTRGNVKDL